MAGVKRGKRIEPLFTSEADAREVMRAYCVDGADQPLTARQIDFLVSRLKQQFWLAPAPDADRAGGTRLGGAPDLPSGTAWPLRRALPKLAQNEAEGRRASGWVVRQLSEEAPFEFVGQIDLAEAAVSDSHGTGLPASGRLLFFVDTAVLMHMPSSSPEACRVIPDETPPAELSRVAVPEKFDEMERWWRSHDAMSPEQIKEMVRMLQAAGQSEAGKLFEKEARKSSKPDGNPKRKPFEHPARASKLMPLLTLPRQNAIELTRDKELMALAENDATREYSETLTATDAGPFTADPQGMRVTQPRLTIEARGNRFLGPPEPEQDDPRFDAVGSAHLPPYPWDAAKLAEATKRAEDWQLLLQVSIASLSQDDLNEGTLYFLIRKDALARRDLSSTTVVYQQT